MSDRLHHEIVIFIYGGVSSARYAIEFSQPLMPFTIYECYSYLQRFIITMDQPFQLVTAFSPSGDQPQAIATLSRGLANGARSQLLLGVTGSGKTFTMASIIAEVQRPALVIAPNKTLAAQLFAEFKELFPHNAVEYFVSYYDYFNRKPIFPPLRHLSNRILPLTTPLTRCVIPPPARC